MIEFWLVKDGETEFHRWQWDQTVAGPEAADVLATTLCAKRTDEVRREELVPGVGAESYCPDCMAVWTGSNPSA